MTTNDIDTIERGDRVSWKVDGQPRIFGRAIRRATLNYQPAFTVREDCAGDKTSQTVLARDITKECG